MTTVLGIAWFHDIGGSLKQAFFMFWATLWPLALGFSLSGAVQAFVSKGAIGRAMGSHRPAAVLRATGYGMASSSCSYAATALARSMVAKGADFVTAMVFMFASTNLVLELGLVLVVLLGWQFAVAEFSGGPVMIVLLVLTSGVVLNRAARTRLTKTAHESDPSDSEGAGASPSSGSCQSFEGPSLQLNGRHASFRSLDGWSQAARLTMHDTLMLRRELLIGYVAAGFLTVLVPAHIWNDLFVRGHGFWTSLENAVIGPFVAIISFVCSIGNVPLAASLWKGGISFGGVVSFLFADLITFPLLLIYRKYYGTGVAARMLLWFWCVMALAGFVVEGLAHVVGLIPAQRSGVVFTTSWSWDYTTYLNFVFMAWFAGLYVLSRRALKTSERSSGAIDPVCGMPVQPGLSVAFEVDDQVYLFCSDRCRNRFTASKAQPYRHLATSPSNPISVRQDLIATPSYMKPYGRGPGR